MSQPDDRTRAFPAAGSDPPTPGPPRRGPPAPSTTSPTSRPPRCTRWPRSGRGRRPPPWPPSPGPSRRPGVPRPTRRPPRPGRTGRSRCAGRTPSARCCCSWPGGRGDQPPAALGARRRDRAGARAPGGRPGHHRLGRAVLHRAVAAGGGAGRRRGAVPARLLLLVPARAHRFLGLLALVVAGVVVAAVLVPLADRAWQPGRFAVGFWFALGTAGAGLLGACKALLTGPKLR